MATSEADYKLIKPFMHSLSHLALVKTAFPFFNEFHIDTLESVYTVIQPENSTNFNRSVQERPMVKKAKEKLLLVPALLRLIVLKAAMGMHYAFDLWQVDHGRYIALELEERVYYWKYDGTLDRIKIAQELVRNANLNIQHRFNLACLYCLQESVEALWVEMQESGELENLNVANYYLGEFWVGWLYERPRIPWLKAAKEYLGFSMGPFAIYGSFFTLMQPIDRKRFLRSFGVCIGDDIRLCLYSATEEEEREMLKVGVHRLLFLLLHWPFQSFFRETAYKLLDFIQLRHYRFLLDKIWIFNSRRRDFDYCELYYDFYNMIPQHLKERVKETPYFNYQIDSVLEEMRRREETKNSDKS